MDVSSLAFERVFEELKKALLKSTEPSIFFTSLKEMKQLSFWFKEVEDLIGIEQSKIHHPEGDVFTHSMMVLDEAAKLKDEAENKLSFMLAALCHDFGKISTTKLRKGKLTAYGHEVESVNLAHKFLNRLTNKISLKKEVLNLVNKERAAQGLKPLTLNKELSRVATLKSKDMNDKNYFDHTSPTYGSPFDMMKTFNISYKAAGENIAMGQRTPSEVMTDWMNSSGHRANILNSNFTELGVGIYKGANGTIYWTQMFIGK